jgi:hypothetical protein
MKTKYGYAASGAFYRSSRRVLLSGFLCFQGLKQTLPPPSPIILMSKNKKMHNSLDLRV